MHLAVRALIKYLLGLILVSVFLFVPAGTLLFPNAWLFIALLFLPMLFVGTALYLKAPALLEKRINVREKEKTQKNVVKIMALVFLAGFVMAGLDHRLSLSNPPSICVIVASVLLIASYALYAEVMRENAYLSRTVEVSSGQKVIDTGLYGIVRHPMYSATVILFLSIPVVLGSWWSLIIFALYVPAIVVRIINEEKILRSTLRGYCEYMTKVKYRLIPFVW